MTDNEWWRDGVREPGRVEALRRSRLRDAGPEDVFDRLTELAAAVTGATRACITLVDASTYVYKSAVGVPEGAPQVGPIEESFCRYVVGSSKPFVVDDARLDPSTCDNPAIELSGVVAWAGYPIEDAAGSVLGTFCLIVAEPYSWTDTDLHVLATLARAASSEIELAQARRLIASACAAADEICTTAEGELSETNAGSTHDTDVARLRRSIQLARELSGSLSPSSERGGRT